MNRFILFSALAIMMCTAGLAVARVNWPAGWSVNMQNDSVVAQSPPVADGTAVFLIASPVERATSQSFAAWFDMKVRAAATNGTTIGLRQGTLVEDGTLYKDGYELRQAGKLFAYAFSFAYDTPQGRQFLLILRPKEVDKNDPRVLTALDTLADAWRAKLPLHNIPRGGTQTSGTSQPSRPATPSTPPSPAPASGGNCRDEMTNVTTWTMQQVCYPSAGGMSNCHLESVPVQQRVLQTVCR